MYKVRFYDCLFIDEEIGSEKLSDLPKVTQPESKVAEPRFTPKKARLQTSPILHQAAQPLDTQPQSWLTSGLTSGLSHKRGVSDIEVEK